MVVKTPLTIATKIKYLGIHLKRNVQNLYEEIFNIFESHKGRLIQDDSKLERCPFSLFSKFNSVAVKVLLKKKMKLDNTNTKLYWEKTIQEQPERDYKKKNCQKGLPLP